MTDREHLRRSAADTEPLERIASTTVSWNSLTTRGPPAFGKSRAAGRRGTTRGLCDLTKRRPRWGGVRGRPLDDAPIGVDQREPQRVPRQRSAGSTVPPCFTNASRLDRQSRQKLTLSADRSARLFEDLLRKVVGASGFEPPTPRSRTKAQQRAMRAVGISCEHGAQNARLRALRAAGFPQIVTSR